ncbi:hypothetical protein B7G68_00365 [Caulobacter segnis]|uniref:Uncharacterized protein n=2 Tax=Caulobacter segnis TaxID=88688 RepID=D5VDP8_CAUST|nr:hypothetical protein [Caulobacter segnis]ADG08598.1 conserved hypothetical protein [Caulobacter segnis ATCC 21756]AVQ00451.1 hypothetical protein B7G68_00365 [Caulobacter segnis]
MSTAIAIGTWRRPPSRRDLRRNLLALGAVLGVHALVLLALVSGARWTPQLIEPPIIHAELVDTPSPQAKASPPPPLARPSRPVLGTPAPAPPTNVAALPAAKPSGPPAIVAPPGFTARKLVEQSDETRKSLRDSLGCRHEKVTALTRDEKAACAEADGKRALTAPMYAAIDPDKKAAFDGDCKKDDEWCLYRVGKGPYPGIFALGKKKKRKGWDD